MNLKKILPYIGALLVAIMAVVGLVKALSGHTDTPESWDQLIGSVKQVQAAADLGTTAAVSSKDYDVCVSSSVTSSVASAVADSLTGVKSGTCHIPDVSVDVTKCLALKATPAPTPDASPAPATDAAPAAPAPASEVAPAPAVTEVVPAAPVAPAVETKDVGSVVDLALGPVLAIVQGAVTSSNASPAVKAWSTGVVAWITSGKPSLVAFVEDPKEGKFSFKGQDIEGCKP